MKNMLIDVVVKLVVFMIYKVKNEEIFTWGERAGKWVTDNAREAIGDAWEDIEVALEEKQQVFIGGFNTGKDYDDKN